MARQAQQSDPLGPKDKQGRQRDGTRRSQQQGDSRRKNNAGQQHQPSGRDQEQQPGDDRILDERGDSPNDIESEKDSDRR